MRSGAARARRPAETDATLRGLQSRCSAFEHVGEVFDRAPQRVDREALGSCLDLERGEARVDVGEAEVGRVRKVDAGHGGEVGLEGVRRGV